MRTSTRILLNAVSRWILSALQAGIGVLLVPFLLHKLGQEVYGLVPLIAVIVTIVGFADLGLRGGLSRHLAEELAKNNTQRFNELISTGTAAYALIGGLGAAVVALGAPLIVRAFNLPMHLVDQAEWLVRWYGSVAVLTSFLQPVFSATLTSHHRFDLLNMVQMVTSIVTTVAVFAVLGLTEAGLYGYGWIQVLSLFLHILVTAYFAYRVEPALKICLRNVRKNALGQLFFLGSKLFGFRVTELLSLHVDPIIITRFVGPAGVALYQPGQSLPKLARPLVNVLAEQMYPVATESHIKGRTDEIKMVLLRGTRYTFLMGIVACVTLAMFAHPIMRVWLGNTPIGDQCSTTAWILVAWSVSDLCNYASGTQWAILLGMDRLNFLLMVQVVGSIINIAASVYLVGYTQLGVVGVVVPTAVIAVLYRPIMIVYMSIVCGVEVRRFLWEAYCGPLVVLGALLCVAAAVRLVLMPDTLIELVLAVSITGTAWLPLCWLIGLSSADRAECRQMVRLAMSKIGIGCGNAVVG